MRPTGEWHLGPPFCPCPLPAWQYLCLRLKSRTLTPMASMFHLTVYPPILSLGTL